MDFQDGGYGGHFGYPISTSLTIFDLQVALILHTKFRVICSFRLGEEVKKTFSRRRVWWPSWNSTCNGFSYFWSTSQTDTSYQVSSQMTFRVRKRSSKEIFKMATVASTLDFGQEWFSHVLICTSPLYLLPSFESTGLSVQENKIKIDFQYDAHGGHLWLLNEAVLQCLIFKLLWYFLPSLFVQEKFRIEFHNGGYDDHLGFPFEMILAIFDLQVASIHSTKFRVNWPFGSGEEVQNRLSNGHGGPLGYPTGMILAIFDLQGTPILPVESIDLSVQEKKIKIDFQDGGRGAFLDFRSKRILLLLSCHPNTSYRSVSCLLDCPFKRRSSKCQLWTVNVS